MSIARGIIHEIKRRLGDVNATVPDESDIIAYLNSALRGIWNYAVELDSPRIEIQENASCDETGKVTLSLKPIRVTQVIDKKSGKILPEQTPRTYNVVSYYNGMLGYYVTLGGIQVLQGGNELGGELIVSYYPDFTPLEATGDELPFASALDDVVIAWTIKLITSGKSMSVADMGHAGLEFMNSLAHYFETWADERRIGQGPW